MSLYGSVFRRVLFPAYESGLRRRHTLSYLREYERNQWLDAEQIQALQWQKLTRLIAHCWSEVPYYRRRWQALGLAGPEDIRDPTDYARLPLLTKQDIRDNFEDLIAPSHRRGLLFKSTGGSTGEPLRFGYTRESYERRTAVMWRGYGWSGVNLGGRTIYLWGGSVGDQARSTRLKEKLYHRAFNRRMLDSFAMRDDNLDAYARAIADFRPTAIVSYVGPLLRLARWMVDNGKVVAGVRTVLGAAEALHDFHRPLIESAFPGSRAYNTYGCREFMLIASECEHRSGLHVNSDHLRAELMPSAPGAENAGELVLTDLHNYGMPFIRYANGDLATQGDGAACGCGRGLPRLRHIDGRKLDAIRTPQGHVLPGEFFPHMLKDVVGVRRFQLVQTRLDAVRLSIVAGPGFGDEQGAYIRREIARVLGPSAVIDILLVDEIPLTSSGRLRVTISEVA